jgi:hypothetical protein
MQLRTDITVELQIKLSTNEGERMDQKAFTLKSQQGTAN